MLSRYFLLKSVLPEQSSRGCVVIPQTRHSGRATHSKASPPRRIKSGIQKIVSYRGLLDPGSRPVSGSPAAKDFQPESRLGRDDELWHSPPRFLFARISLWHLWVTCPACPAEAGVRRRKHVENLALNRKVKGLVTVQDRNIFLFSTPLPIKQSKTPEHVGVRSTVYVQGLIQGNKRQAIAARTSHIKILLTYIWVIYFFLKQFDKANMRLR